MSGQGRGDIGERTRGSGDERSERTCKPDDAVELRGLRCVILEKKTRLCVSASAVSVRETVY